MLGRVPLSDKDISYKDFTRMDSSIGKMALVSIKYIVIERRKRLSEV